MTHFSDDDSGKLGKIRVLLRGDEPTTCRIENSSRSNITGQLSHEPSFKGSDGWFKPDIQCYSLNHRVDTSQKDTPDTYLENNP